MATNSMIQTNISWLPQVQYTAPNVMHFDLQGICQIHIETIQRCGQLGLKFELEKADQSKSCYEVYLAPTKTVTMYKVKTLQPGLAKPLIIVEDQTDNGGVRKLFNQRREVRDNQQFFNVLMTISGVTAIASWGLAVASAVAFSLYSIKLLIASSVILFLCALCSGMMVFVSENNRMTSEEEGNKIFYDLIQTHLRVLNLALNLSQTGTTANEAYQIPKDASFKPLQRIY